MARYDYSTTEVAQMLRISRAQAHGLMRTAKLRSRRATKNDGTPSTEWRATREAVQEYQDARVEALEGELEAARDVAGAIPRIADAIDGYRVALGIPEAPEEDAADAEEGGAEAQGDAA